MDTKYLQPFLESAQLVFTQLCQITPQPGKVRIKEVRFHEDHLWIKIGLKGQITGDIIFGLHEKVALKVISAMMGGYDISEIDEIGKSAISELGNMISGNAGMILYNQGINIDITPPILLQYQREINELHEQKALSVPMYLGEIGYFHIQVIVNKL